MVREAERTPAKRGALPGRVLTGKQAKTVRGTPAPCGSGVRFSLEAKTPQKDPFLRQIEGGARPYLLDLDPQEVCRQEWCSAVRLLRCGEKVAGSASLSLRQPVLSGDPLGSSEC